MADEDTAQDESTLSDDLATAWDEAETEDVVEEQPVEEPAEEAPEPEAEEEAADDTAADEESTEDEGEEPAPIVALEHWDAATKEAFEALPDEAKPLYMEKVTSLEKGYQAKFEELAEQRKGLDAYTEFDQIFAPYQQDLALAGMSAPAYVQQLMAIADRMRTDAPGTLQWLAQQNGVDLQSLAPNGEADEFADPAVQRLEQKFEALSSTITQQSQASQQASLQQANAQIAAFRDAVDEQGSPKHPHFETVEPTIGALLSSGQAADLDAAYSMAVRAHPELGTQVIEAEVQKALAQKQAEQKAAVKKSKAASANAPTRKVAAPETPPTAGSVKDDLERNYESMMAAN